MHTYIYNGKRESCEGAELVGVLVAETIHPACMCEGGGRGGGRGGRAFCYTYNGFRGQTAQKTGVFGTLSPSVAPSENGPSAPTKLRIAQWRCDRTGSAL